MPTSSSYPDEPPKSLMEDRHTVEHALRERIKELHCLYAITRLAQDRSTPLPELLKRIAQRICASWQYPEITCARICLGKHEYTTVNYRPTPWRQQAPLRIRGEIVGEIEVSYLERRPACDEGPFLAEERNLIDAVAELVAQIVEQRWTDELMGALSRELIRAQENERQRIARELHDHLAQELSLAVHELSKIAAALPHPEALRPVQTTLETAIASLRDLAYGLLPPGILELGLVQALAYLCEEMTVRFAIPVAFSADGVSGFNIPFDTQINLYRLTQEALTNIRKHSRATRASVRLIGAYPSLLLRIEDNGQGMDLDNRVIQAVRERRMGLWSMQERVRLMHGAIRFRSQPGKGMRIVVEVPVGEHSYDPGSCSR